MRGNKLSCNNEIQLLIFIILFFLENYNNNNNILKLAVTFPMSKGKHLTAELKRLFVC